MTKDSNLKHRVNHETLFLPKDTRYCMWSIKLTSLYNTCSERNFYDAQQWTQPLHLYHKICSSLFIYCVFTPCYRLCMLLMKPIVNLLCSTFLAVFQAHKAFSARKISLSSTYIVCWSFFTVLIYCYCTDSIKDSVCCQGTQIGNC